MTTKPLNSTSDSMGKRVRIAIIVMRILAGLTCLGIMAGGLVLFWNAAVISPGARSAIAYGSFSAIIIGSMVFGFLLGTWLAAASSQR